tara:strand:+ start:25 stop:954 length:930 start_codon:yes stop_codon:yes gene_type:complete
MAFLGYELSEDENFSVSGAYRGLMPEVDIPLVDPHAWARGGKFRGVYNKLNVALDQGVEADLVGSANKPTKFPVIVRPVYNLWGMGHLARVAPTQEELDCLDCSGHFWTTYLVGDQFSWDFAVVDGEPEWVVGFYGSKKSGMRFDYWAMTHNQRAGTAEDTFAAESWVRENLKGYTGMVNVETIGNVVIECQLRIGDVIVLMADRDFMKSVIALYETGEWNYSGGNSHFHLLCLWTRGAVLGFQYDNSKIQSYRNILMGAARSWSIEFDEDWKGDPIGHKRVMLIGSESWHIANELRSRICEQDPNLYY